MFRFRSMVMAMGILLMFSMSVALVHGDPAPRSWMVLVTVTSGGSVLPEGAVSVPSGCGITLTFTPSPGYEINKVFVDGTDAGHNSTLTLFPVTRDMTVHAVFAPGGRSSTVMLPSPDIVPGGSLSVQENTVPPIPDLEIRSNKSITVGPSGADYNRIQDAVAYASDGDTIYIQAGTYPEKLSIDKPVSLIGLQEASGLPVISSADNGTIITVSADHVLLKNLTLTSTGRIPEAIAVGGHDITDLTLDTCGISNAGTGIGVVDSRNISVRDCTMQNISGVGLFLNEVRQSLINGNTIEQSNAGMTGFRLANLTFRDNRINSCNLQAVLLQGGITDSEISDNFIVGNGRNDTFSSAELMNSALYVENAENLTISGNLLNNNQGTALTLNKGSRMTISGNTMKDNNAGFTLTGNFPGSKNQVDSSNTVDGLPIVYYDTISGETIDGVSLSTLYLLNCTAMTMRNLTLNSPNGFGIQVIGGSDINISDCQVGENRFQNILVSGVIHGQITGSEISYSSHDGIGLNNVDDFTISGCTILNNSIGTTVCGNTSSVMVTGNTFISNGIGFHAEQNTALNNSTAVSGNLIAGGETGIKSEKSTGVYIIRNEITGVNDGLHLTGSAGLHIEGNTLDARNTGIRLSGLYRKEEPDTGIACTRNVIANNSVSAGRYPVILNDTMVHGNSLYLNDFITNTAVSPPNTASGKNDSYLFSGEGARIPQVADSAAPDQGTVRETGMNSWDTGQRVRYSYHDTSMSGYLGNHWSNYTGTAVGTSGTGDLPVYISNGNADRYPLLENGSTYHLLGNGYYLELQAGWNFVSPPTVLSAGSDTARIFEHVNTTGHSIYTWQNATWIPVKRNDPVVPLRGYWIFSRSDAEVPFSFNPGIIPAPVHLSAGWNAIGYPGLQPAAAHDALSSLGDSWKYAAGFNASLQAYEVPIMREEGGNSVMFPSQGYWIYMDREWVLQPVTG